MGDERQNNRGRRELRSSELYTNLGLFQPALQTPFSRTHMQTTDGPDLPFQHPPESRVNATKGIVPGEDLDISRSWHTLLCLVYYGWRERRAGSWRTFKEEGKQIGRTGGALCCVHVTLSVCWFSQGNLHFTCLKIDTPFVLTSEGGCKSSTSLGNFRVETQIFREPSRPIGLASLPRRMVRRWRISVPRRGKAAGCPRYHQSWGGGRGSPLKEVHPSEARVLSGSGCCCRGRLDKVGEGPKWWPVPPLKRYRDAGSRKGKGPLCDKDEGAGADGWTRTTPVCSSGGGKKRHARGLGRKRGDADAG